MTGGHDDDDDDDVVCAQCWCTVVVVVVVLGGTLHLPRASSTSTHLFADLGAAMARCDSQASAQVGLGVCRLVLNLLPG